MQFGWDAVLIPSIPSVVELAVGFLKRSIQLHRFGFPGVIVVVVPNPSLCGANRFSSFDKSVSWMCPFDKVLELRKDGGENVK